MAKTSPAKYVREVRQEMKRVTWPTRKETTVSTTIVVAIVMITAVFFLTVDTIIGAGVRAIIGIGGL